MRNWSYCYALAPGRFLSTIQACGLAACPDEADEFFDCVTTSAAGSRTTCTSGLVVRMNEQSYREGVTPLEGLANSTPFA